MPLDKNGVELQIGDDVIIRAKVTGITSNEFGANLTVRLTEQMPFDERQLNVVFIDFGNLNTKMAEKQ